MLRLDHIAVAAERLDDGVAHLEALCGVEMAPGGKHAAMGTHNRLLGMGELYLEVIAVDPDAPAPGRARWFDLDRFAGPPRLNNWIARCDDLGAVLERSPEGSGTPMALARGDLRWQMAVPDSGALPFDNVFPALMSWEGSAHPAARLPDSGVRLTRLEVLHPAADALSDVLAGMWEAREVAILTAPAPGLRAHLQTPNGPVVLA